MGLKKSRTAIYFYVSQCASNFFRRDADVTNNKVSPTIIIVLHKAKRADEKAGKTKTGGRFFVNNRNAFGYQN